MDKGFQRLYIHFTKNLKEIYETKKNEENGLEVNWKSLDSLGTWINKKIKMIEGVAQETCGHMTVALSRFLSLELNMSTLAKKKYVFNAEEFSFIASMEPLRHAIQDWPPKTFSSAAHITALMEEALNDMAFYYTIYKDESEIFKNDFIEVKKMILEIKTGLKLEEMLHHSVKFNIDLFTSHLIKFETKLADI